MERVFGDRRADAGFRREQRRTGVQRARRPRAARTGVRRRGSPGRGPSNLAASAARRSGAPARVRRDRHLDHGPRGSEGSHHGEERDSGRDAEDEAEGQEARSRTGSRAPCARPGARVRGLAPASAAPARARQPTDVARRRAPCRRPALGGAGMRDVPGRNAPAGRRDRGTGRPSAGRNGVPRRIRYAQVAPAW